MKLKNPIKTYKIKKEEEKRRIEEEKRRIEEERKRKEKVRDNKKKLLLYVASSLFYA